MWNKSRSFAASAIAGVMLTGLGLSGAIAAAPDLRIYAELPQTQSVVVSPDGNRLAMLSPNAEYKSIFVYDLNDPNAKTIAIPAPKDSLIKSVFWGSPKHIVMRAQFRRSGQGRMRKYSTLYSRYVSTNVDTGKSVILMGDRFEDKSRPVVSGGSVVSLLPNDPESVRMAFAEYTGRPYLRHFRVNLDTGKEAVAETMPIETGSVILSEDGEQVVARSEYDADKGVYTVLKPDGGFWDEIYQAQFDKEKNSSTSLVSLLSDGSLLMYDEERSDNNFFTVDPETGALENWATQVDVPDGYSSSPILHAYTNEVIGVSYTDDTSRSVYVAEPFKSWHEKLQGALPEQSVYITAYTPDMSMATIVAAKDGEPAQYYLFESDTNALSPLGGTYPGLKPSDIGQTIRMDYAARDGLNIPSYLTLPPGKTLGEEELPLIVMPHGGPQARDTIDFNFWSQFLASRGYVVFRPQFRGSAGFGWEFTEKGRGQFGSGMLDDTIDGVNMLIEKGYVDADRICVTGASYGGYQSLALPMVEPDMFKCALSVNGVAHLPDMLKFVSDLTGRDSSSIRYWREVMGDRSDDKDLLISQSPAENLDKIKAAIMLVHGEDDMTVPIDQTEAMAKALKKAGKDDDIIILKNDDHNLSLAQSRAKLLRASEAFFKKHIG